MLKPALVTAATLIALIGGSAYFFNARLPDMANAYALDSLRAAGFAVPVPPAGDVRYNAARFENIILDAEGFSKIRRLEIRYNPAALVLLKSVSAVKIEGLSLTGDIAENGAITVSGWQQPAQKTDISALHLKSLSVEESNIAFLTRNVGGISVAYDFQLRANGNGAEFRGNAKSSQKHLTFIASATGLVNDKGFWQSDIEIEQGKFEIAPIKASRVNGSITISATEGTAPLITSDLRAGGLTLYDFPWQNASIAIEKQDGTFKILSDMKSVGVDGVELNLQREGQNQDISGSLQAESLADLAAYLIAGDIAPIDTKAAAALQGMANPRIDFAMGPALESGRRTIIFNIKNNSEIIELKGKIDAQSNGDYTGTLANDPVFLGAFEAFMTGAEPDQSRFRAGNASLSGDYSKKGKDFTGTIKTEIADGVYDFGGLRLEKISGALVMDDLKSLSAKTIKDFSCALPLVQGISHNCKLSVGVTKGKATVKSLNIGIFGGLVSTSGFSPLGKEPKLVLEISNIDLGALTRALKIKGLTATGTAAATLPLTLENGKLVVRGGRVFSAGPGVLQYKYETSPEFFVGNELELETIRLALENYNYDSFEFQVDGAIMEKPEIAIIGNGLNPNLPGQNPVAIRMKTSGDLHALFKNMIRP